LKEDPPKFEKEMRLGIYLGYTNLIQGLTVREMGALDQHSFAPANIEGTLNT
jgi:hypothetical protein